MKIFVSLSLFIVLFLFSSVSNHSIFGITTIVFADQPNAIEKTDQDVVAVVNGQNITKQQLYELLVNTYGEDALDVLIRRTLIVQEAEKEGVTITRQELEKKLTTLIESEIYALMRAYKIEDKESLKNELQKLDSDITDLEKKLARKLKSQAKVELLAEKVMDKKIVITEKDLKEAYENEYGEKIEARQIVFKLRRDAEDAAEKLRLGADFATMAQKMSIDRASAARGGMMQPFSPNDSLGQKVAHLKPGEISSIIQTDYGYHILKIIDRKKAKNKSFESVKDELEKIVRNQISRERLGPWLISLIEKASIKRNLTFD